MRKAKIDPTDPDSQENTGKPSSDDLWPYPVGRVIEPAVSLTPQFGSAAFFSRQSGDYLGNYLLCCGWNRRIASLHRSPNHSKYEFSILISHDSSVRSILNRPASLSTLHPEARPRGGARVIDGRRLVAGRALLRSVGLLASDRQHGRDPLSSRSDFIE